MRISYKLIISVFFFLYLLPIFAAGVLVYNRIQERQATLQLFLQNQVDVDRKILEQIAQLRQVSPAVREFLLKTEYTESSRKRLTALLDDAENGLRNFFKRYETQYAGEHRPLLQSVLIATQELNLLEEEKILIASLDRKVGEHFEFLRVYLRASKLEVSSISQHAEFLERANEIQGTIYSSLNELADIRYIYGQRIVFFISGENDRQQGFFNTLFIFLVAFMVLSSVLEYFYIHKPFRDIMDFLKDSARGTHGERLYFSTPVKEIKESEEIINKVISVAEKHEREKKDSGKISES